MRDIYRAVEALFRSLSDTDEASSISTTWSLWEETAWLRADTYLKTPDTLLVGAAKSHECTLAVTSEREFLSVQALSVVAMDNLLDEKPTNAEVVERTVDLLADCSCKNARCQ